MKTLLDDFLTEQQSDDFASDYQEWLDSLQELLEQPTTPTLVEFIASMKRIATRTKFTRHFMDYFTVCGNYYFTVYPQESPTAWRAKESKQVYNAVINLLDSIGAEHFTNLVTVTTAHGTEYVETTHGRKFTTTDGKHVFVSIVPNETASLVSMFR